MLSNKLISIIPPMASPVQPQKEKPDALLRDPDFRIPRIPLPSRWQVHRNVFTFISWTTSCFNYELITVGAPVSMYMMHESCNLRGNICERCSVCASYRGAINDHVPCGVTHVHEGDRVFGVVSQTQVVHPFGRLEDHPFAILYPLYDWYY